MSSKIVTWIVFFKLISIIVGNPVLDENLRKHFYGLSSEEKVTQEKDEEVDTRSKRLVDSDSVSNGLDPKWLERFYADEKRCGCKEMTTERVITTTEGRKKKQKTVRPRTVTEIPTTTRCPPKTTTTRKPTVTTTRCSTTTVKPTTTSCRPKKTSTSKPTTTVKPTTTTTKKPTTTTTSPPSTTSTTTKEPTTTTNPPTTTSTDCCSSTTTKACTTPNPTTTSKTTSTTSSPSTTTTVTSTTTSSTAPPTTTSSTSTHKPKTHRPKGPHHHPVFRPAKPDHALLPFLPPHSNHHKDTESSVEHPIPPPPIPRRHRLPPIFIRPDCTDVETCSQHREAIRRILRRLNRLGPSDRRSDSELDEGPLKLDTVGLMIPRQRSVGVAPVVMSYDRTRNVREEPNPKVCRRPEEHRDYVRYLRRTLREVKRNLRIQWNDLPQCTDR